MLDKRIIDHLNVLLQREGYPTLKETDNLEAVLYALVAIVYVNNRITTDHGNATMHQLLTEVRNGNP